LRGAPLPDLNPLCEIGGAGNKCLHIVTQRIDCYISMSLDMWDICAGEVIVKGCGGSVTDFKGNDINYDRPIKSVIVTGSKAVFEKV
jgi:fructose-1,6-bisphosphatase/inositol monophosphatase family enzyme